MVPGLADLTYEDRLKRLKLPTLRYRRSRGDVIEGYKILSGKYDQEVSDLFELRNRDNTRGHRYKIYKNHSRLNIRKNSFCNRIVNIWNSLQTPVVESKNLQTFERRLAKYWENQEQLYEYKAEITTEPDSVDTDSENEELVLEATNSLLSEQDL